MTLNIFTQRYILAKSDLKTLTYIFIRYFRGQRSFVLLQRTNEINNFSLHEHCRRSEVTISRILAEVSLMRHFQVSSDLAAVLDSVEYIYMNQILNISKDQVLFDREVRQCLHVLNRWYQCSSVTQKFEQQINWQFYVLFNKI